MLISLLATPVYSQWSFQAGYAPMVGVKTEFSSFGNFAIPAPMGPLSPSGTFTYLDGFVGLDVSGNEGDLTSFWSYNSAEQVVAGNIEMHSLTSSLVGAGSLEQSSIDSPQGFELSGYRHLGSGELPFKTHKPATWGLRIGYQYNRTDVQNFSGTSTTVGTLTDSYSLGVVAPHAPYTGPFNGIGALLDVNSPTRILGTANAAIAGMRDFDAHLNIIQLGSYLDIPLSDKFDVLLESGFLLGIASGSYDFTSSVTIPELGSQTTDGSSSGTRVLPGAYLGVGLRYGVTSDLSLQTSARYQLMRPFELTANGSNATLDINSAVTFSAGVVWHF